MFPTLRRLRAATGPERRLLGEALVGLGLMRAAVAWLPFARIVRWCRLVPGESPAATDPARAAEIAQVAWAVAAAAARTPWASTCLVQALAAQRLLRARGLPATLYLGLAPGAGGAGPDAAHAWLRCGAILVAGGAGAAACAAVGAFVPAPEP